MKITKSKKGFLQTIIGLLNPTVIIILVVLAVVLIIVLPILTAILGVKIAGIALMILGGIVAVKWGKWPLALGMIGAGILVIVGVNFDLLNIVGGA